MLFRSDVIYAEGVTAETFGSSREARDHFDNFAEYHRLYSSEDETAFTPCAPSSGGSRGSTGFCGPCALHWSRGWTREQEWTKSGIKSGIGLPRAPEIWSISEKA